jgi:hypothetical protein
MSMNDGDRDWLKLQFVNMASEHLDLLQDTLKELADRPRDREPVTILIDLLREIPHETDKRRMLDVLGKLFLGPEEFEATRLDEATQ